LAVRHEIYRDTSSFAGALMEVEYADFSIKARCDNLAEAENRLMKLRPEFIGEDLQTDTYFQVPIGRMKLRQGNIENLLTHYYREESGGKMRTTVFLYERNPTDQSVKNHTAGLSSLGQVIKRRRIFFVDNVKFHFDRFDDGLMFIEIEAIDSDGSLGVDFICKQAEEYKQLMGIRDEDVLTGSYIDLIK
jgi:adenylate cyclase, class 2